MIYVGRLRMLRIRRDKAEALWGEFGMFKKCGLKAFMDKFAVVATDRPEMALRSLRVKAMKHGFDPDKVARAYVRRHQQWVAKQERVARGHHHHRTVATA